MESRMRLLLGLGALSIISIVASGLLAGCSSPTRTSPNAANTYVLVTLKRGERAAERTQEERVTIQERHLANIRRLAHEGTLLVAGPYGKDNHDPASRGIFIFGVATLDEATRLTNTDPAVIAGVLAMDGELLTTGANLRAAIAAELAREADEKAKGIEPKMGEHIRPYALVRTFRPTDARRAIAHAAPHSILIDGTTGDGRGFLIVDAKETKPVREWLGETFATDTTVDEWYASDLLNLARDGMPEVHR